LNLICPSSVTPNASNLKRRLRLRLVSSIFILELAKDEKRG
jgi:hypothetical protein